SVALLAPLVGVHFSSIFPRRDSFPVLFAEMALFQRPSLAQLFSSKLGRCDSSPAPSAFFHERDMDAK
ncbi:hypothetical protein SK128_019801, partial [Halocaridina rubra]